MKAKQIGSLVVAALGVVLIVIAFHAKGEIDSAQGKVDSVPSAATSNPLGRMMRNSADRKIEGYNEEAHWTLIGGVAVLIAGGAAFFFYRSKKHFK